ncbi:S8 family serine peptidase [Laceyella putida]|uniref:S8 family serine peptidase n=1 Tax=Laceyella putida TaxID=110101 RepID=A0ABW2RHH3_9BACL
MNKLFPVVVSASLVLTGLGWGNPTDVTASSAPNKPVAALKQKWAPGVSASKGKHVSVIVEMGEAPTALYGSLVKVNKVSAKSEGEYRQGLVQKQKRLIAELKELSPGLQVKNTYDTVFAGMAVTLKGEDLQKLASFPEVKRIYPIRKYKALMTESAPLIGAPNVWKMRDGQKQSVTGKGIKVAVIDTGVDATHPDLKKNVIGGYDFVENDKTPQDEMGHGTHVAGTIGANGKIKGVAPDASILAYRVLGADGGGTTDWIMAGIDQAVRDKADVMNLSLGMDVNVPDEVLSQSLERAIKKGIVVVLANGNAGPAVWSVGSPAASSKPISVGASTKVVPAPVAQAVGDDKKMEMNLITFSPTFPLNGTYSLVDGGTGKKADFQKIDAKGKIVLVKRSGDVVESVSERAKKAGALAVIVYNNKSGDWFAYPMMPNEMGEPDTKRFVPTATLSGGFGAHLMQQLASGKTQIQLSSVKREKMVDFSSRGPATGIWEIKPDVTAPGVDIVSTLPRKVEKTGYGKMSGTSMAAPHVAGAAALLLQKHPDWNPDEVKAALANTAVNLKDTENKHYPYISQGAGRIDLPKAIRTQSLVVVSSLSFGLLQPKTGVQQMERRLQVENLSNKTKRYELRAVLDNGKKGIRVTVPSSVTVGAKSVGQLPVSMSFDTSLPRGSYTGAVYLQEGTQALKVPFIALNEPKGYQVITGLGQTEYYLSPDGDGKNEFTLLTYYLAVSPASLEITAESMEGNEPKVYSLHKADHPATGYTDWLWNGKDTTGNRLPDGDYLINVSCTYLGKKAETQFWASVDTQAPVITDIKADEKKLSGKVKEPSLSELHWRLAGEKKWREFDEINGGEKGVYDFSHFFKKGDLKPGKNTVTIRVKDWASHVTTKNVEIQLP